MKIEKLLKACDLLADSMRAEHVRHGHITIEIGLDTFEELFSYFDVMNLKPVNRLGRQWNEPEMLEYKQIFRFKAVPLREMPRPTERYFR